MAVLAAMVSIALDMVIRVSASFWMTALVNKFPLMGASSDGMTSQAMQQGGMGLILTTLILTAPPMAAMFFQGTLGSFMAYSQIGGSPVAAAPGPNGQPPGSYSYYTPDKPSNNANVSTNTQDATAGVSRMTLPQSSTLGAQETGLRGANR